MKRKYIAVILLVASVISFIGLAVHANAAAGSRRAAVQHGQETKARKLQDENRLLQKQGDELRQKNADLQKQLEARATEKARQTASAPTTAAPASPQGGFATAQSSPTAAAPGAPSVAGSGSCADEIAKYDWPKDQAERIMQQESGNNPGKLNDNPLTGDYSVGCFQVNLFGRLALNRPSEDWLKVASNNVSYAYGMWKGAGGSFCTSGGWINTCAIVGLL